MCDDVDSCVGEFDACSICNGPGAIYECGCEDIPAGDCDCDGNQLDALELVAGRAKPMETACDDVDSCVGEFDACGICNGPEIYEGCADTPEGACDCNGNQLDALGTCGGTCEADDDGDGVTTWTAASGNSTHVASATGQVPFTMWVRGHPCRRLRLQRQPTRRPGSLWRDV